ncbi:hypothetical protein CWC33_08940 [Idiomarina sp. X4]|uniref:hypothetical protein n=1 Tax=Idiomarina sp. X4 TaxID=2055892 RepID=UPI000C28B6DA|nr:hypothetical protein [Idiomarina sp. X4]ATZ73817.1 hypothetical protein CWC33_08940 [Idiomarina sp. X4]
MKALIIGAVSGVMLFSSSAFASDKQETSLSEEIQAQVTQMTIEGLQLIKETAVSSMQEWASEALSFEVAAAEPAKSEQLKDTKAKQVQ